MTAVRFLLNGAAESIANPDPTSTLLSVLRYRKGLTGTKEGCAEGDCGACTVLVGELDGEGVNWRAVNACILFLPMIDGKAVLTVEGLSGDQRLNPVQRAMVEQHGSQCGFCTPGFVMSLHGRAIGAQGTQGVPVADVIAGNLCRCTGYGPILEAGALAGSLPRDDEATAAALGNLQRDAMLVIDYDDPMAGTRRRWSSPPTTAALAEVLAERPQTRIVAGATDVGLWVTKQLRVLDEVAYVGDIAELQAIEEREDALALGAAARYVDAAPALARLHPAFAELIRRIGGLQVRSSGTVGGNIANGSPIGDTPPALIALGAALALRSREGRRTLPLEDYFIAYGRQDRRPGEFVEQVIVPRPDPDARVRIFKLSKRFDSDISAVCGAFAITVKAGRVTAARVAFGGMAGTPCRAAGCEAALLGQPWTEETVERAAEALASDYTPLTDVRGSAAYRRLAAANLLRKLWLEEAAGAPDLLKLEPVDA